MKKIAVIASFISYPFVFAASAFAAEQVDVCPTGQFNPLCGLKYDTFGTIVSSLITLVLIIAVVISLFFLIYGGIKWVTSGGDKTGVESARNHIVAAIVGLAIALLAYLIINIVLNMFGISLNKFTLPTLLKPNG